MKLYIFRDAAQEAMPENMTIPILEPLPERVDFMKDELEDLERDLANQTQQIPLIELKVGGIEVNSSRTIDSFLVLTVSGDFNNINIFYNQFLPLDA